MCNIIYYYFYFYMTTSSSIFFLGLLQLLSSHNSFPSLPSSLPPKHETKITINRLVDCFLSSLLHQSHHIRNLPFSFFSFKPRPMLQPSPKRKEHRQETASSNPSSFSCSWSLPFLFSFFFFFFFFFILSFIHLIRKLLISDSLPDVFFSPVHRNKPSKRKVGR